MTRQAYLSIGPLLGYRWTTCLVNMGWGSSCIARHWWLSGKRLTPSDFYLLGLKPGRVKHGMDACDSQEGILLLGEKGIVWMERKGTWYHSDELIFLQSHEQNDKAHYNPKEWKCDSIWRKGPGIS